MKVLEDLNDDLRAAAKEPSGSVSVAKIMESVGSRSFGTLLILLAVVALTPLGGIPTLPTVLALIVLLLATQLLFGMNHFWLPDFILRQSVQPKRLVASLEKVRPAMRWVDQIIRPRLTWMTGGSFARVLAVFCIAMALTIPPLEVVPFGGTISWAAIALFGVALIARDGLVAIIGVAFSLGAAYTVYSVLS